MAQSENTLLDVFSRISSSPETAECDAVQCGAERWTYGALNAISTGLALELVAEYGARPTVAIISENLPYTLAFMLAVWKLGGIVAPLDHHAPATLVEAMLRNIRPHCVVALSSDQATRKIVSGDVFYYRFSCSTNRARP